MVQPTPVHAFWGADRTIVSEPFAPVQCRQVQQAPPGVASGEPMPATLTISTSPTRLLASVLATITLIVAIAIAAGSSAASNFAARVSPPDEIRIGAPVRLAKAGDDWFAGPVRLAKAGDDWFAAPVRPTRVA
jgi:hypothetical protein